MSKKRPILFNTAMVQAILNGKKTQTRRVIKMDAGRRDQIERWTYGFQKHRWGIWHGLKGDVIEYAKACPYGAPQDLLWVRETFCPDPIKEEHQYKAGPFKTNLPPADQIWKPSIYMPKDMARIWLIVGEVAVERIQDISDQDIVAEGVGLDPEAKCYPSEHWPTIWDKNRLKFALLWDEINARRGYSWAENPWVWVVRFGVYEAPKEFKHLQVSTYINVNL